MYIFIYIYITEHQCSKRTTKHVMIISVFLHNSILINIGY